MKMTAVIFFLFIFHLASVGAMYSSKAKEGYPSGYMSDCPGSTEAAVITPSSLKNLFISVVGPGNIFTASRTKYTYYQMKKLASDTNVDFNRKTFLYVGGYLDSSFYPPALILGKDYYDAGYNVLVLDTNAFVLTEYPIAARFMRPVGFHAAEMLANLTSYGLDPKKLELVGLSLGGQTMSFIAKNYRMLTGMNISRLTALDPAGPCFRNLGPDQRLDQSDADFVDVVDTNIDGYGMAAPVGHVNFYVNGGEFQPGDVMWYPCGILCSHIRSLLLWHAALQYPHSFIAIRCSSVQQARERNCYDNEPRTTNLLGPNVDRENHGVFYLATTSDFPYHMGLKGLRKEKEFFKMRLSEMNKARVVKF